MATKEERQYRTEREEDVVDFLRDIAIDISGKDKARKNRVVTTVAARDTLFLDQLTTSLTEIFKNKVVAPKYSLKASTGKTKRIVNLMLSDLHFHSLLDPLEVGHAYGPTEEARRLSAVCLQAAEYKLEHRADSELYIHICGDIIQGQLHDQRDGAPLAEQASAAMYLLVQAVQFLAGHYPKGVKVFCTPGNHGRNTARHRERATLQKFDSIETIIYTGIKIGVAGLKNVTVEIPKTPYYTYNAFNKRAFITHGDTVINPGYPGKTIDVSNVRKQINEINGSLADNEKYSLFAVGHVHVGSIVHLPNGAVFLSNGCLIPPDAYAISIGIFDTACGQWIWESVPDHVVGDHRFVVVDEKTDKDTSLDKLIQPFLGF